LRSPWAEFGLAENIAATKLGEGRQEPPKLAFPAEHYDRAKVAPLVGMIQERVKILSEVPALIEFLCVDTIATDQDAWDKTFAPGKGGVEMLDGFLAGIDAGTPWETAALKELTEKVGEANGLKLGKAQAPLRVAVTGKTVGMPMFESLEALGAPVSLARLRAARAKLG
jgi:glutamyl-tRNA synthetase